MIVPAWRKSSWLVKSRNTLGTRTTHSPLIISHAVSRTQEKPGSIAHADEQPSPSMVLPSSQSSAMTRPSPHSDVQETPEQSGSRKHNAEQPSKGSELPSSHASAPSGVPLPQSASVQTLGS